MSGQKIIQGLREAIAHEDAVSIAELRNKLAEVTQERDDLIEQIACREPTKVERDLQAVMKQHNEALLRAEAAERALSERKKDESDE